MPPPEAKELEERWESRETACAIGALVCRAVRRVVAFAGRSPQRPRVRADGGNPVTQDEDRELPQGADESAFVWGRTRTADDEEADGVEEGDAESTGDLTAGEEPESEIQADVEALATGLAELSETAEHVSLQATNADLKVARGEYGELPRFVYDIEADARSLRRTVADLEDRVERLRRRFGGDEQRTGPRAESGDRRDGPGSRSGESTADTRSAEGERRSRERIVADPEPPGPRCVAGVDLARWPGHLATMDFERAKERVPQSETVLTAGVPADVAGYSLGEGELPFEALLARVADEDRDAADGESASPDGSSLDADE